MSKNVVKRGRPSTMTKEFRVNTLRALSEGADVQVSKFLLNKFVETGHVEFVKVARDEHQRGRPRLVPQVTAKGRNFLRLSESWFKPVERAEPVAEEVPSEEADEVAA